MDVHELISDVLTFASRGGGFWRIADLELPAISALPAVKAVSSDLSARLDAVETTLRDACLSLAPPWREAALSHLGLVDDTVGTRSRTARQDAAAAHLHMDGRTYRRKVDREGRYESWALKTVTLVAEALLHSAARHGDLPPIQSAASQQTVGAVASDSLQPDLPRVAFVCALPSAREHATLYERLSDVAADEVHGVAYFTGILDTPAGPWRAALLATGRGNANAYAKTFAVLGHFCPSCAFFLGCAGGFADKGVARGDLIVPRTAHLYQSGVAGATELEPRPVPAVADDILVNKLELLQYQSWLTHKWRKAKPKIFFEDVVSGDISLKSTRSKTYKFIRRHYGHAVAVEMEGYGFLSAAKALRVPAVLVRGASDQLDNKTERSDRIWQPRATSAAFDLILALLTNLYAELPATPLPRVRREHIVAPATPTPAKSPLTASLSAVPSAAAAHDGSRQDAAPPSGDVESLVRPASAALDSSATWARPSQNADRVPAFYELAVGSSRLRNRAWLLQNEFPFVSAV